MSETTIALRVEEHLKKAFELACKETDTTVSQVLRQSMRKYIDDLFALKVSDVALQRSDSEKHCFAIDPETGIQYDPNLSEDINLVKKTIALKRAFLKLHPEVPLLPYEERETLKKAAWAVLQGKKQHVSNRMEAMRDLMKAHYARSVEHSLSVNDPSSYTIHPGFSEYASHYLMVETPTDFTNEIIPMLQLIYPPVKTPKLLPGNTDWQLE